VVDYGWAPVAEYNKNSLKNGIDDTFIQSGEKCRACSPEDEMMRPTASLQNLSAEPLSLLSQF